MTTLRLLSFNIQVGIHTRSFEDYLLKSWQHLWPYDRRFVTLQRIADFLQGFDIVGLQEVDGGGARSHYVIQTEYLARRADFPFWYNQVNRRLGQLALHSNGLLSRLSPSSVYTTPLPGVPGRGALMARFGDGEGSLFVIVLHLALGTRVRARQLDFIAEHIKGLPHVVVMGDLNCGSRAPELRRFLARTGLRDPQPRAPTFPSWRPRRKLDHILVSPAIQVNWFQAFDFICSDHLPIGAEVVVPINTLAMAA
ncbi:MAG TPA: EEP domain-containing protein [Methylothermaceae bacterium]|nr:EEP domain-containing protein [Methylothermaceae bacterium]